MSAEPQVLFLHPVALDKRAAGYLDIPNLSSVTLPGNGNRKRQRPGLTIEDMADEIAGWTEGPLHLVGISMGGMVALHFALRFPERVASLVLGFTSAKGGPAMLDRAAETERRGSIDMLDETMARWFTEGELARSPRTPQLDYVDAQLRAADSGSLADMWRAIAVHDVVDQLPSISVPVTCVAGIQDVSTPLIALEKIAAGIPNAELVTMDAAHMGFLEKPDEFSAIVRTHLERATAH